MSKKRAYFFEGSDDDSTPLNQIVGFAEFNDHVYAMHPYFGTVKVPLTATWGEYNSTLNNTPGVIVLGDVQESNLTIILLVAVAFTLAAVYLVRQYKPNLAIGVMALLVVFCLLAYRPNTTPETTLSWDFVLNNFLTMGSSQLRELSKYAAKVNDGTFEESNLRLGLRRTIIPGTSNAVADETMEYLTLAPSTVLPLHRHSSRNYALALTSGLEYTINQGSIWRTWKRGEVINVPKGIEHSVRNVSSSEARLLSTSEGPLSALSDFLN